MGGGLTRGSPQRSLFGRMWPCHPGAQTKPAEDLPPTGRAGRPTTAEQPLLELLHEQRGSTPHSKRPPGARIRVVVSAVPFDRLMVMEHWSDLLQVSLSRAQLVLGHVCEPSQQPCALMLVDVEHDARPVDASVEGESCLCHAQVPVPSIEAYREAAVLD